MLAAGELDVALVSSFEFLRSPMYRIIDAISIASDGPVYSVVVAHEGSQPGSQIELDPASETSVALLHLLVNERGASSVAVKMEGDMLSPLQSNRSRLLIGDQAIRFRQKYSDTYRYWDLGEEWKGVTRLPFVYALWLVRPEVSGGDEMGEELRTLRDRNLDNLGDVIALQKEFSPDFCSRYYTEYLRFSLGDREKAGLSEFARRCAKLGLIHQSEPALELV